MNYQRMVVIFVDLLGTKNNTKFENKYRIHRLFHEEARKNEERNPDHTVFDRRVYSFSDCAYFFYYFKDGKNHTDIEEMKMLQVAMYNTSQSLLRILNAGYLVRGGVALGDSFIDELGFFGPAVEEAYKLESEYADVPMVALSCELGQRYCSFEDNETDDALVEMMMTSRPRLVEIDIETNKYYLNYFYQLECFSPELHMETESINIYGVIHAAREVIDRDKKKYKKSEKKKDGDKKLPKSTIYEKLEWMEEYLSGRHNRLNMDVIGGAFSAVISDN